MLRPLALSFKGGNNCARVSHERGFEIVQTQELGHYFFYYYTILCTILPYTRPRFSKRAQWKATIAAEQED